MLVGRAGETFPENSAHWGHSVETQETSHILFFPLVLPDTPGKWGQENRREAWLLGPFALPREVWPGERSRVLLTMARASFTQRQTQNQSARLGHCPGSHHQMQKVVAEAHPVAWTGTWAEPNDVHVGFKKMEPQSWQN